MGTGSDNKELTAKLLWRQRQDHRQLVEDYKRYAGQSCQPSWELIEDSAKRIMWLHDLLHQKDSQNLTNY